MRPSKPRIKPLKPDEWSEEQHELLKPVIEGKGLARGVLNVFSTLVRHPKLYKRWSVFATHVLFKSSISAREREMLILRTAHNCGSAYEWGQHESYARAVTDLSDPEIDSIKTTPPATHWSECEGLLLTMSDELHTDHCISDETWNSLLRHLSETQIMDAIFTVGNYTQLAMALNSFGVQLESTGDN